MDPQLEDTISSCLDNADSNRIHIAVCDQSEEYNENVAKMVKYYNFMDWRSARGPCFARHLIQNLIEDERWYLQIDSHTKFEVGWDTILLGQMSNLPPNSIITGYPRDVKDLGVKSSHTHVLRVDKNNLWQYDTHFNTQISVSDTPTIHQGYLLSAGNLFSSTDFCRDVPYDPHFYFEGEEPSLALRAYCMGYDIYHVPNNPIFHDYRRNIRPLHWEKHQDWGRMRDRSMQRYSDIIHGKIKGVYGIGWKRSLNDYKNFSGIDYINKTIT